jgi:uncharacterized protein (TIGR04222 family)
MSPAQSDLLGRILEFNFDGPEPVAMPFVVRLARERGWSRSYTDRVIIEYKRYIFLAATSSGPVCPSEDVDAAWHMHLTYTRSYWKRICGEILGKPLHHEPTRGGASEADKHHHMYERTLTAYRSAFGTEPPTDIWPAAAQRFGQALEQRVVNTAENWVIPKAPAKRVLLAAAAGLLIALVPGCVGGDLNPFDLVGESFVAFFFIPVLAAAVLIGRLICSRMRVPEEQPGDDEVMLTWEQVAYLSGGYPRLMTAAIARLVERGAVIVSEDKSQILQGEKLSPGSVTPVERVIFESLPVTNSPTDIKRVNVLVNSEFGSQVLQLEEEGFILSSKRQIGICLFSMVPLAAALLLVGTPRLLMGIENHRPYGFLLFTMIAGGVLGTGASLYGAFGLSKRGQNVLVGLKAKNTDLKKGWTYGTQSSIGLAVGLFGTAVLTASGMDALKAWFPRRARESGSGCGSGGCGGSGCGGGSGGGGGGCGGG